MPRNVHSPHLLPHALSLRLPVEVHSRLEALSVAQGTSIEAQVTRAIEEHLCNQARLNILANAMEARLQRPAPSARPEIRGLQPDVDYLDELAASPR